MVRFAAKSVRLPSASSSSIGAFGKAPVDPPPEKVLTPSSPPLPSPPAASPQVPSPTSAPQAPLPTTAPQAPPPAASHQPASAPFLLKDPAFPLSDEKIQQILHFCGIFLQDTGTTDAGTSTTPAPAPDVGTAQDLAPEI